MRVFIFLLLFSFWTAHAGAKGTILIMGDSLSAGYGISKEEAWPSLLQQRLTERGHAYRVVNASISGDTTHGGLKRLLKTLEREKPQIVIIELGANDGLRGLHLQDTEANLDTMVGMSQDAGAKVLLLGIQLPVNYGSTYRERFSSIYARLAEKRQAALVPFFLEGIAETHTMMQPDGLHPKAAAQPAVLENVWTGLAPLLK
ncbi:MAG TPA: arylesterase [Thiolapillus brandeum]|uniref:Arylesterase n=1 Tax=Thiolapillus brandeum TaxID=1076588 RepID=A0A831WAQ4_9GAMM|nr:arylesterase [Thiolapillus brandeum]